MIKPMIRELRKTFPDAFIATLTQPGTVDVFKNNPYLDKTITDDLKKETFWKVIKEIKSYKFTDGLLVLPTERAAFQMFWAGIKNRVGVGRILYEVITFMKSVSRNNYTPLRHEADYCMDMARKIGVVTNNIQPEIFVSDEEKEQAEDFFLRMNIDKNAFRIILHTGSKNSAPNWNEEKYYRLLVKILNKFPKENYVILLTALEMSDDFLKKVNDLNDKRIFNISKEIKNLRELIKVISGVDLMICSSTGPIHLADALNIKCIGIHCRRDMNCSRYWGVLNQKSINLEVSKEFCDNNCSKDKEICKIDEGISTDEVLKHVEIFKG